MTKTKGTFQNKRGMKRYEIGKSSRISTSIPMKSNGKPFIKRIFEKIRIKPIRDKLIAKKKNILKFRNLIIFSKFIN